jgi:hypothetical protein
MMGTSEKAADAKKAAISAPKTDLWTKRGTGMSPVLKSSPAIRIIGCNNRKTLNGPAAAVHRAYPV